MCLDHHQPPPSHVAWRGVLATAMALAGASLLAGTAEAADRTPTPDRKAPGTGPAPSGGTLVIDGGTLLDPLTGEVTANSVVVIVDGTVRAAGSRDATRRARAALRAGVSVVGAHGRWVLPGLVDAHIHINSLTEAGTALRQGATSVRSGSTTFYQDIAVRELARWAPDRAPRTRAAGLFVTPDLGDTILADPDPRWPASRTASARPRRCAGWST